MEGLLQISAQKAQTEISLAGFLQGHGLQLFFSQVGTLLRSPHFLSGMELVGGTADLWKQ
jgi:hypothetical protein|tara:strand:- start:276 stop:455 length:180 start_codon:yes stop_codon:yes gene_type:complete